MSTSRDSSSVSSTVCGRAAIERGGVTRGARAWARVRACVASGAVLERQPPTIRACACVRAVPAPFRAVLTSSSAARLR
eukprot:1807635-Prymnesium_polylepis.1